MCAMYSYPITSEAAILGKLYARVSLKIPLGLERMAYGCAQLGHPERQIKAIHVAGTNGKGSVCAMVESIARTKGLTTGLYTSPHLCDFRERIRLNGEPIEPPLLIEVLAEALAVKPLLSFFSCITLASFLVFQRFSVDIAILEVGLGGRLDATNVLLNPLACAITRIAYDHTMLLGSTLAEIAREKAGIAKAGVPFVVGPLCVEAKSSVEQYLRTIGITPLYAMEDAEAVHFVKNHPAIGLAGKHQLDNAAIAYVLGRWIGATHEERAQGIANVQWPGRLERIERDGHLYLLDAAHNPDGAIALASELAASFSTTRMTLLFGTCADKDWLSMLHSLAPLFHQRIYVEPPPWKDTALHFHAVASPTAMASHYPGHCAASIEEALTLLPCSAPIAVTVVCGSIYIVGYVRALLLDRSR